MLLEEDNDDKLNLISYRPITNAKEYLNKNKVDIAVVLVLYVIMFSLILWNII